MPWHDCCTEMALYEHIEVSASIRSGDCKLKNFAFEKSAELY